ncbi:MAG: hypothetical protein U0353_14785 [Sandaracinus sp.]
MSHDDDERRTARMIRGESWASFCDQLKNAGQVVLSGPDDELTRAEGFRYLSRIARAALQTFVEHGDPRVPVLQRVVHETAKMGADNPDNVYLNATLHGDFRYVVRGKRPLPQLTPGARAEGQTSVSLATQHGHYGRGNGMPPVGQLDTTQLTTREDGRFEIFLATRAPDALGAGQHFLPIGEGLGTLIVRQYRLRPDDVLNELRIERDGGDGAPAVLTGPYLDDALEQCGGLVNGAAMLFSAWAGMFQAHTNQLPRFDQEMSNRFGGLKDIAYYHSYWRLADDEALVIEASPPPCDHWNFQLNNHWMESLDYRFHRIHLNSAIAATRPDGSIRLIVAHTDPGLPNWIETVGHRFGTMCFRWVRPSLPDGIEPPVPSCRVVKHAELGSLL